MIELGKIQKLVVARKTDIGVYLKAHDEEKAVEILLPKSQVSKDTQIGDELEVFIYRDSEDRLIATTKEPKVTIDKLAMLKVVEITRIGAFLDWGLEKDLFLPFKEQIGKVVKGKSYMVGVYIDKSDRLCATMKIYNLLKTNSPYKTNNRVTGIIYSINEKLGIFVAIDHIYHGLIPAREVFGNYKIGDTVEARVKTITPDGKLELSLRKQAYYQIDDDAQKIINMLKNNNGKIHLNDDSSPGEIKESLNISKAAFKRALGRLLKEGKVEISSEGTKLL
jgi:predicted RNA-binding protein (virulence factor B family)